MPYIESCLSPQTSASGFVPRLDGNIHCTYEALLISFGPLELAVYLSTNHSVRSDRDSSSFFSCPLSYYAKDRQNHVHKNEKWVRETEREQNRLILRFSAFFWGKQTEVVVLRILLLAVL